MRFGHVLVKDDNHQADYYGNLSEIIDVADLQFVSNTFVANISNYDGYARGLLYDNIYTFTPQMNDQMLNKLFLGIFSPNKTSLGALNNHRCRDHGVRGYTEYRRFCRLYVPKSFEDLLYYMRADTVENLRAAYKYVEDIDLWTGLVSERSSLVTDPEGGFLPPLTSCNFKLFSFSICEVIFLLRLNYSKIINLTFFLFIINKSRSIWRSVSST
jgi:peroxidase